MRRGGVGGSSTRTGLRFEAKTDLREALERLDGVRVEGDAVTVRGSVVATLHPKGRLYTGLLGPKGVKWGEDLSAKLLPDEALHHIKRNTLYVVEKKCQEVAGSVDEKLQTCAFKKRQYSRLLAPLGITVRYCYVLNGWFEQSRYRDVLEYIQESECDYFFNQIPRE